VTGCGNVIALESIVVAGVIWEVSIVCNMNVPTCTPNAICLRWLTWMYEVWPMDMLFSRPPPFMSRVGIHGRYDCPKQSCLATCMIIISLHSSLPFLLLYNHGELQNPFYRAQIVANAIALFSSHNLKLITIDTGPATDSGYS